MQVKLVIGIHSVLPLYQNEMKAVSNEYDVRNINRVRRGWY